MVFYGIVVINHMAVVVAEMAMWCVTLVPVFYLACRDFSGATRLNRDRLTPSTFLAYPDRHLRPRNKELGKTPNISSKPLRKQQNPIVTQKSFNVCSQDVFEKAQPQQGQIQTRFWVVEATNGHQTTTDTDYRWFSQYIFCLSKFLTLLPIRSKFTSWKKA